MRATRAVTCVLLTLCLLLAAPPPALAQQARLTADHVAGLPFRTIGPANMSGRIVDLAVIEQDPYVFYAATSTGGVWKRVNNGVTFAPVFEREGTHSVGAIAVHPRDTSIVWVGTGERANRQSNSWGDGVYRSTDGGETWAHAGLASSTGQQMVARVRIDPDDCDRVFVAVLGDPFGPNPERGVFRTTDGGASWQRVLHRSDEAGAVDLALDPSDARVVFAGFWQVYRKPWLLNSGGPGSGLFRSMDGGDA
jgi:photosystem II stability/assembly factor-like uncharacterized protein